MMEKLVAALLRRKEELFREPYEALGGPKPELFEQNYWRHQEVDHVLHLIDDLVMDAADRESRS